MGELSAWGKRRACWGKRDERHGPKVGTTKRMGSIDRYIFRATLGAFLLVLVSLTTAVWMTQALRDIDLMTNQGQTVLTFIGITALIVPLLMLVIAPVALVIAATYVLNKLSTDSEIIVLNGSGMRPMRLLRPFVWAALVVTAFVIALNTYLAPKGMRMLREAVVEVRTDLVTNIVQPGRFTQIERGLTFHIRERRANGLLIGILLDDRRDEKERVTIVAEQGEILKTDRGRFLILENGSIQRHELKQQDPSIVRFERYAFDLSRFSFGPAVTTYSVRERYLPQLLWAGANDAQFNAERPQIWVELHDRILGWFYPLAFVMLTYAFLGSPRTTRQSTAWAIASVIASVATLRLLGFGGSILTVKYPIAVAAQYLILAVAFAGSLYVISRGLIIEPPATLSRVTETIKAAIARRLSALVEPTS
jgi:lipopolysaccharide export system permease protein